MKSAETKQKTSAKTASSHMKDRSAGGAAKRFDCIATAAYFKAEARGFVPGQELDDWLEAEAKFDASALH